MDNSTNSSPAAETAFDLFHTGKSPPSAYFRAENLASRPLAPPPVDGISPFIYGKGILSSAVIRRDDEQNGSTSSHSLSPSAAGIKSLLDDLKKCGAEDSTSRSSGSSGPKNNSVDKFLEKIRGEDFSRSGVSSEFKTPLPVMKNKGRSSSRKGGNSVSFSGIKERRSNPSSTPKYSVTSSGRTSGGHHSTTSTASSKQTSVIVALSEGRGVAKGEVGLASFDLKHPELVLAQFADTAGYSKLRVKLQILNPLEIVVPESASGQGGNMTSLIELLQEDFPKTQITTVHRKYFNTEKGKDDVGRLRVPDCSSVLKDICEKYYCLASVAALVKYVEHIQNINLAPGSVKVTYTGVEKTCMIDPVSVKHLELIVSLKDNVNTETSLNGILNSMSTGSGARLLRANILQPPADSETTQMRLDAVEELLSDEQGFRNLKSLVSRLVDVDQLIGLCVNLNREETIRTAEYKLTQVIYLKHSLELIDTLRDYLAGFQSQIFKVYRDHMLCDVRLKGIIDKIAAVFHDDVHHEKGALNMRTQKCFAVKPGLNGLLDVARRTYTELVTDVNDRINQSVNEIFLMSNVIVTELLGTIREDIGCLYNVTEAIAVLDMVISLANYCSLNDCVRPEFTDCLVVKKGRHPLLDSLGSRDEVVANDTYAGPESSFVVITGPNMAGKSTYLKQVALLQIMAQAGCFIPAEYGSFQICSQIFTRIGHNDDLSKESSAFMVEMKDMAYILQNLSARSLVIIDELGRSTATTEAIGISFAICEELIASKAIVFFATHFLELMDLDTLYSNVENYHFNPQTTVTEDGRTELVPDHSLKKGPYQGPLYGLEFAEVALLPPEVVKNAKELAEQLRKTRMDSQQKVDPKEKAVVRLGLKLIQAAQCIEDPKDPIAAKYLMQLKNRFLQDYETE